MRLDLDDLAHLLSINSSSKSSLQRPHIPTQLTAVMDNAAPPHCFEKYSKLRTMC